MGVLNNYDFVADYIASMSPEMTLDMHAPEGSYLKRKKVTFHF